jgi:hypothetical protein
MSRNLILALLCALSCTTAACQKDEPIAPATVVEDYSYARLAIAVTHMDLDLAVDFDRQVISGTAAFDLDNQTGQVVRGYVGAEFGPWCSTTKPARWRWAINWRWWGGAFGRHQADRMSWRCATADAHGVQWLIPAEAFRQATSVRVRNRSRIMRAHGCRVRTRP